MISGLKIRHKKLRDGTLYVSAHHPTLKDATGAPLTIGHVHVVDGHASDSYVHDEFRRHGIATAMYQHAEKVTGAKLRPGHNQSPDARALWGSFKLKKGQSYISLKDEELEKSINGNWENDGLKIKVTSSKTAGHVVRAYKGRKRVGHLAFSDRADREGYHPVYNADINEEHQGKGLYQHMIRVAAQHAISMGSKGIKSEGFQRSSSANRAWEKVNPEVRPSIQTLLHTDRAGRGKNYYVDARHLQSGESEAA